MALKALMLRKKIDLRKKELDALRAVDLETRETELEKAIGEAEAEDEQRAVEEEIEKLTAEKEEHTGKMSALETEIRELEAELEAEEMTQDVEPVVEVVKTERNTGNMVEKRFGISEEMLTRDGGKEFVEEIRSCINEKRAISNGGLLIPQTFLGIIRENVINYSKLYRHVFVRRLNGEGKLTVMGTIPEAVWTACCANINEIDLGFADVTVDCNKVAAIIPVCNALIEDSAVDLAAEIIEAILIAMGKALDKAILYGTGSGMPLGVYTRLAQTSQPASYPATARPWVDLHTSNILTIANSVTGVDLFKTIMLDAAAMSGKYSRGEMIWCMNETTYKFLRAQGMSVNAAGAIVSAVDGQMPGVGGIVEVLDFIPNYNIIGGYFDLYLLAERKGMTVESAPLARVFEDETIFRGKGRYDGQPVIAEAFITLAINGASAQNVTFAADAANAVAYIQLNKNAVTLATTTGTAQLKAELFNAKGQKVSGTVTWASSTEAKATVSDAGLVTGKAAGSSVITATCGDAVAVCNVTVPS